MYRARRRAVLVGALTAATAIATLAGTAGAVLAPPITNVPTANTKVAGMTRPDKLSPELTKHAVAQGNMALENPSGANTFYGYDGTDPMVPLPGTTLEAHKTEPDKNTYLVLRGQPGADPSYDYGTHFLFQGHEIRQPRVHHPGQPRRRRRAPGHPARDQDIARRRPARFRRLDVGPVRAAARSSPLSSATPAVCGSPTSTCPPRCRTSPGSPGGAATRACRTTTQRQRLPRRRCRWRRRHDRTPNSKQPNSFVYRFVPNRPRRPDAGRPAAGAAGDQRQPSDRLLARRPTTPTSSARTSPTCTPTARPSPPAGSPSTTPRPTAARRSTRTPLAKAAGGTAFKRPENGVFAPDGSFRDFYFTETGDTNADTEAAPRTVASVRSCTCRRTPRPDTGHADDALPGDVDAHRAGQHRLRRSPTTSSRSRTPATACTPNATRSTPRYLFDITHDYADGAQPTRVLAQGRDASATIDSASRTALRQRRRQRDHRHPHLQR